MATTWSNTFTMASNSTEEQWFAVNNNVVRVFYDGANLIKYAWSQDEGGSFSSPVTVDSTSGNNDVMLNVNIAYDAVTGRLHFLYGRFIDSGSNNPVLLHRYTDNPFNASPTFSAEHVIDNGSTQGTDHFYRVGMWANNGHVSLFYTCESNSSFTTNGVIRTLSSDGGATWSTPIQVYASVSFSPSEPNIHGFSDGTVVVSWYDPGALVNGPGDIWIARSRDNGATWDAAATKLTTTTDFGRPRIDTDNGVWWIVANKPWDSLPAANADVYTLHSTDNAVTWSAPTLRAAHTGSSDLDHPDIVVIDKFVGLCWTDFSQSPLGRGFIFSTDGGATFSPPTTVFQAGTSDAPRLLATTNYIILKGYDNTNSEMVWSRNPYFAVLPKDQTSLIDNFNSYSSGALLSGVGNWVASTSGGLDGALKATGTAAKRQLGAGSFDRSGSSLSSPGAFSGNCELWASIPTNGSGGEADLFIWDPSGHNGYAATAASGDFGDDHTINKYSADSATPLFTNSTLTGWVSGDVNALQIIGSTVVYWVLRSGVWTEIYRYLDSTYRSSLKFEVQIAGFSNAGPQVDDLGGGTLAVPANSVAPAASGSVGLGNVLNVTSGTWSGVPTRHAYQWQSSNNGGSTWGNVTNATLPFMTVADATVEYRCVVTAKNSVGSASANSNALTAGAPALVEAWGAILA